ncbi:MAG: twin-arginine translocation signal domain-containing protein, partial [Bacteroidales bacterium]|nr:twin-arginine translocation signal domain-containing protein [Bacteroidales bacterium]
MKRRSFLKNSSALGASLLIGNSGLMITDQYERLSPGESVQKLKELENEYIRFTLNSDASASILDKASGMLWDMVPVAIQDKSEIEEGQVWMRNGRSQHDQYPGRFTGENAGDAVEFTLTAPQNRIIGRFKCILKLDGNWLVYRIYDISDSVPSLVFPPPIQSDAIILPMGVGRIIRNKESGSIFTRYLYPLYTRLNMRWIGGQKDDAAWIGIFDKGFEDSCALVANRTAAPAWTRTLSAWQHDYTFRLSFMKGNYVDLAKAYRNWFRQNQQF